MPLISKKLNQFGVGISLRNRRLKFFMRSAPGGPHCHKLQGNFAETSVPLFQIRVLLGDSWGWEEGEYDSDSRNAGDKKADLLCDPETPRDPFYRPAHMGTKGVFCRVVSNTLKTGYNLILWINKWKYIPIDNGTFSSGYKEWGRSIVIEMERSPRQLLTRKSNISIRRLWFH